jgi:hypothetical protein
MTDLVGGLITAESTPAPSPRGCASSSSPPTMIASKSSTESIRHFDGTIAGESCIWKPARSPTTNGHLPIG